MMFEIGVTENGKRRVDARVEAKTPEDAGKMAARYQVRLATKALSTGKTKVPVVDVRPTTLQSTVRVGEAA